MSKYQIGDKVRVQPKNINKVWTPFLKYVGCVGHVVNIHNDVYNEVRYLLDICNVSWHEYNLEPVDNLSMNENEVLSIFSR